MRLFMRDTLTALCAIIVVFVVAVFGGHPSLQGAIQSAIHLVVDTFQGKHLTENYWGVTGFEIVNTLQLIGLAFVFALILGVLFILVSIRTKQPLIKGLLDGFLTVLESIPDVMYVIIAVVIFLILLERFHINLPLYGGSFHPTFADTIIPAFTIALPAGLQIRRWVVDRLDEELQGQYVKTAISKGNSASKTFYRHVLPNVGSTFFYALASGVVVLLSTLLFATFFFQYHDLFFKFSQAIGWNQMTGFELQGHVMGYVPTYQPGTIALIGCLYIFFWFFIRLLTRSTSQSLFPSDREITSAFLWRPVRKSWILAGTIMFLMLMVLGTFPELLSSHTPQELVLGNVNQPWPLPPSRLTPLGTDDIGHDLFSVMLYGTWPTLFTTWIITVLVTVLSFGMGLLGVVSSGKTKYMWVSRLLSGVNHVLSALPGFLVLFLILYPRNQLIANAWLNHKPSLPIWRQEFFYIFWLCVFEIGRGSYVFYQTLGEWKKFAFMEGVKSIGKSESLAYVTTLRPWLIRFGLSFAFGELSRVLSLMTQLAAFSLFIAAKVGYLQFAYTPHATHGIIAAQPNWLSTLGAVMNQFAFIDYPYLLYGPLVFVLLGMLASNFIARGIRGGSV